MKKIQIIIITLVIILVLGCATFATLYFATDLFKSDKEMFYKYMSQMNLTQITNSSENAKYQERLKTEKYKNEGSISIKLNMGEEANLNESFDYISQVDPTNKLANSTVSINRDGQELLTIDYLRNQDLYGLKFEDIVSQYIVLENNNVKEFAQRLGIQDVSNVPDKIELSDYNYNEIINEEELKQICNRYMNVIVEQIPEEKYSKVEDGYNLTIDLKTLQNILIKVIETLKNDEQVFNLINSLVNTINAEQELSFEQYQEVLDGLIQELSQEIEENFDIINIVVYKQGKDSAKVYVRIGTDGQNGETSYVDGTIEKNDEKLNFSLNVGDENGEIINCTISKNINTTENEECAIKLIVKEYEEEVGNINIITTRNGNLASNNIQNSMTASIIVPEENIEMSMEYSNNKTFDSNLEIEEFNESNHAVINQLSAEQINNLITNLGNRIAEKADLNIVEIIGATGLGIISTAAIDSQEVALIGGVVGGAAISIVVNTSTAMFDAAQESVLETQIAMEQEQMLLEQQEELYQDALQQSKDTEKQAIYDQIVGAMELTDNGKINVKETYDEVVDIFGSDKVTPISPTAVDENTTEVTFKVTGKTGEYTYIITENSINIVTE